MKFKRNTSTRVKTGASNKHIQSALENRFVLKQALRQAAKIAPKFKGRTQKETAENVWRYLRNEITYQADDVSNQNIKLPFRLMSDRVGDCKSFSLFAWAVLTSLGISTDYVYTSYNYSSTPSHIYVETMNGIVVDGVYQNFNAEKAYTHKRKKRIRL